MKISLLDIEEHLDLYNYIKESDLPQLRADYEYYSDVFDSFQDYLISVVVPDVKFARSLVKRKPSLDRKFV